MAVSDGNCASGIAPIDNHVSYVITVKTGESGTAGTSADIFITLVGEEKITPKTKLRKGLLNPFQANQQNLVTIETIDVGPVLWCCLEVVPKGISPDWFVDWINVSVNEKAYFFPVYQWIEKEVTIPNSEAKLPKEEPSQMGKMMRSQAIEKQMAEFRWSRFMDAHPYNKGLNNYMDADDFYELPRNARWSEEVQTAMNARLTAGKNNVIVDVLTGPFRDPIDYVDDDKFMLKMLHTKTMKEEPRLDAVWFNAKDDKEFARQQLNGCRPFGVTKVRDGIPSNYTISDADLEGLLPAGKTIDSEIKEGRLFMVDNSSMEKYAAGINRRLNKPYFSCSPLLLLRCNEDGDLEPLAIQLHSNRPTDNPVWTPKDDHYDWLAAKICFNSTNIALQQLGAHLVECHFMTEPFTVALYRRLSRNHPLYKFLYPHVVDVNVVNTGGRPGLVNPLGPLQSIMSIGGEGAMKYLLEVFQNYNFSKMDMPDRLKKRGTDDPNMIREYGYRDFGLQYWDVIKKYVNNMMDIYYKSDEDVQTDGELQAFFHEVKHIGFRNIKNSGLPDKVESCDELKTILTRLVFHVTINHASQGNGMWDVIGNVVMHPTSLFQPAPTKKGVTKEYIEKMLPDQRNMQTQIALVFFLYSGYGTNEPFLGEYKLKLFTDDASVAVLNELQDDVEAIRVDMDKKMATWKVPYNYIRPNRAKAKIHY